MRPHRLGGRPVDELVSADLDHALTAEESDAFEVHLQDCQECRAHRARQEHLHSGIRTLAFMPVEAHDRRQIWTGVTTRRRAPRQRLVPFLAPLTTAVVVLLAAAVAGSILTGRAQVASPPAARQLVASISFDTPDVGNGTLIVEQGGAVARAGFLTGVAARAELQLARPLTQGSGEIRFRRRTESSYGVLAAAPDLAGSSRSMFGGAFPRPSEPGPLPYDVWLHVDTPTGSFDSAMITIEIVATRAGEEARAR